MRRMALLVTGISVSVWASFAVGEPSAESWSLTELTIQSVPAIWVSDGTHFFRQTPAQGEGFVEVQGRLRMSAGEQFEPVALAEIRLRATDAAGRPQSPLAIGSRIAMCRYLPNEPPGRDALTIRAGESRIAVSRDAPGAPVKLRTEGVSVDLCIAFATPSGLAQSASLEFAGRSFTVPVVVAAKPVVEKAKPPAQVAEKRRISWGTVFLAALGLLVVAFGAFAVWRWRKRSLFAPASDIAPPAAGEPPVGLRGVSAVHCRTTFAPVGKNDGPGRTDFEGALREIQSERFQQAELLLALAIEKGLPPTFECGAWLLRGQAAIGLGQIGQATDYFLRAMEGGQVTAQAALPAAMYLATIYRALGWHADARQMEALTVAARSVDLVLAPEIVQRIQEQARAYRQALRASRPSRFGALMARVFKRAPSTSAT